MNHKIIFRNIVFSSEQTGERVTGFGLCQKFIIIINPKFENKYFLKNLTPNHLKLLLD